MERRRSVGRYVPKRPLAEPRANRTVPTVAPTPAVPSESTVPTPASVPAAAPPLPPVPPVFTSAATSTTDASPAVLGGE